MMKHLTLKSSLYWGLPITLLVGSAYTVGKARTHNPKNPIQFVTSGETGQDSEKLEHIRADWHQRNKGMGLRDVSRSGGGV
ncbi:uncharacterized protein BX664DRAFT_341188 [Halteromyces radiatus]|uniref:uncharacterized protein n=1 Tax=Halteromyces radiatus TaxID=101107 RepID=UPI00221F7C0B|nr:uncharacterized protein BX664DRAFT_341188 [Halteromyces radiatus]KAI8081747.1 hypothetical protein BX664DRAFT_341188 [Halteromyces radiatus]